MASRPADFHTPSACAAAPVAFGVWNAPRPSLSVPESLRSPPSTLYTFLRVRPPEAWLGVASARGRGFADFDGIRSGRFRACRSIFQVRCVYQFRHRGARQSTQVAGREASRRPPAASVRRPRRLVAHARGAATLARGRSLPRSASRGGVWGGVPRGAAPGRHGVGRGGRVPAGHRAGRRGAHLLRGTRKRPYTRPTGSPPRADPRPRRSARWRATGSR